MKNECQDCEFFEIIIKNDYGRCKKYAPKPFIDNEHTLSLNASWPQVLYCEWCGEFKSKTEKKGENE
jgi:hypothetical protein